MKLKTSLKTLLSLVWILQVASETSEGDVVPQKVYPQVRIVGGNFASQNQLPYQISVQGNGVLCGGSIISRNYILTAAHCVEHFAPSTITIRAGTTELREGGVLVGVSEVKPHPRHDSFNYDIALLKLSKPLTFSDSIRPIALATQNPPAGAPTVVSGWGGIYDGGPISLKLKYNTLTALSLDECKRRLNPLPSTAICFGHTAGNSICGGDSGGPAAHNNRLVGVAIYGVNGCNSDIPNGFTSVANVNKWIRDNSDL